MPIASSDIDRPVKDFLLARYGNGANDQVALRFDSFGSLLTDGDFTDANHPDRGVQAALAVEKFSDLVNRVPMDAGDGANVILTPTAIDDIYYYQLLSPSIPAVPPGSDQATLDSITHTFNAIKAEALRTWDNLKLASSTGSIRTFEPSIADPADWYEPTAQQVWTSQRFHIEASGTEGSPLFLLQPTDEALRQQLTTTPLIAMTAEQRRPVDQLRSHDDGPGSDDVLNSDDDLYETMKARARAMSIDRRTILYRQMRDASTQASSSTSSVDISFEYARVGIERRWWKGSFIDSENWYLPGVAAGQITSGNRASSLGWLPIGVVLIRKLEIASQRWSDDDLALLAQVTRCGPFQVEALEGQTLKQPGMTVLAWILQRLPALPHADPPTLEVPPATRWYTVVAGDTLSRIAQQFYGDSGRYPDIQHANGITNPDLIYPGQVLRIP